jgi:hypothetical protein
MIKECKKCGVILCDKNLELKCDRQCKQCKKKNLFCTYKYEDPELEAYSIIRRRYFSSVITYQRNHRIGPYKRKGECFKCGVILCDKNHYKSDGKASNTQCKHCRNNQKSCRVSYPKDICKKITNTRQRNSAKLRVDALYDNVVKNYLRHVGYTTDVISPEMIEIKKKQLLIKRELRKQGVWVR